MKTLYVSDLDGTLLNPNDQISEYSIRIINQLIEKGLLFTYATARSLSSASIVTKGLIANLPVIVYFTCIGEKEELLPIYNALVENEHYNCTLQQELYREEYWCEIMPKKATKANAIQQLKELWHCHKVISFGDAINDIPMFQISDECYAVENAVPELKKIATGIIANNEQNGVAKWLLQNYDITL